jgi:hypothetical protein
VHGKHYISLGIMAVVSFISMYILMYAMVNEFSNAYPNVNQFYMAALMTAPMIIIEVVLMGEMYRSKKANMFIVSGSVVVRSGSIDMPT